MKKEKDSKKKNNNSSKELMVVKFSNGIKKRWLITRTNTFLLIAILIAVVILINSFVDSLKLTPIDCTANKEYTLTEESKNRIKNIDKDVNIYFIGFSDEDPTITFSEQYHKVNERINIENIDINERIDIAQKYQINESTIGEIIIENGEKSKIIYSEDLFSYDEQYNTIDLTEEKITSSIVNVTRDNIPKVYFLTNFSDYNLTNDGAMNYLSLYLKDEVLEFSALDLLVKGNIPEDCDTLVITTPTKDFDELATNEITKYINKGGNILWLNSSYAQKKDLPNVNKILALYGVDPFSKGYIYETDIDNIVLGYAGTFLQKLGNTDIDKNLNRVLFQNPTKINVNEDKLLELNVEKETIISTADTTYYREDVSNTSNSIEGDEQGGFDIAAIFTKKIKDQSENSEESEDKEEEDQETTSKLVIYGENEFITDKQLSNDYPSPMIFLENNADLVLNSIAYLTDQDEDITIRKNYSSSVLFTATEGQKALIMKIIFLVPIAIIFLGIIVWQIRRRMK